MVREKVRLTDYAEPIRSFQLCMWGSRCPVGQDESVLEPGHP